MIVMTLTNDAAGCSVGSLAHVAKPVEEAAMKASRLTGR
jgi:hypothetical protein